MTGKKQLSGPPDEHGLSEHGDSSDLNFPVLMARIFYVKGQIKVLRDSRDNDTPSLWQNAIDSCNKLIDDVLTCQKEVARMIMHQKWPRG